MCKVKPLQYSHFLQRYIWLSIRVIVIIALCMFISCCVVHLLANRLAHKLDRFNELDLMAHIALIGYIVPSKTYVVVK